MKRIPGTLCSAARRTRRVATARRGLLALQVLLLLVAVQADVTAQEAGAPASEGIVPPPAGTDLETLRKLLGLPSRAEQEAERAAPAPEAQAPPAAPAKEPEAQPVAEKPAEPAAPAARSKPKVAARPAPAKAAKPVARKPAPKPSAPSPAPAPAEPLDAKQAAPAATEAVEAAPAAPAATEAVEAAPAAPAAAKRAAPADGAQGSPQDVPADGTVITAKNMERWKHLLGPSIQWAVSRGATLPVIDATPAPIEPFREEATQRYSSQVTLAPDKNSMRDYIAGIPFPLVNDDDPDVAIKMMFNFENRISVDDVAVKNFSCDTGRIPPGKPMEIERHYESESFRRIFYTGRYHVDPKPTWKTKEGIRYREMLGALQEPFDLKGAGFTYIRYLDAGRPDDSWLYFPQFKRVRRLSSAQRSEGVFGQDIDLDSYAGYAGNPAWSDWKYLGKKTVLGVMHGRNMPAKFQKPPADFFPDDVWEPREVYILLAVSRLGGYNFGQRVLYLDRESLLIPYTEIYDLHGSLWKSLVQTWTLGRKPIPTAKRAVYDYDQFYIPSITMLDIQNDHVTMCALPSPRAKGEEGWYFNFGPNEGTTENMFSVSHFIEIGR